MERPFLPTRKRGRPPVGRPSNQELARRLNQARVELCRLRKRESAEQTAEQALLDLVPDKEERLSFEEWQALPVEDFQRQLDYLDARDLGIDFFLAGESAEDRTARIYQAVLDYDGIDHKQAMERVEKWKQREEKAERDKVLPGPTSTLAPAGD
jgi:hypothetical protein